MLLLANECGHIQCIHPCEMQEFKIDKFVFYVETIIIVNEDLVRKL